VELTDLEVQLLYGSLVDEVVQRWREAPGELVEVVRYGASVLSRRC
jgi:hypothetical protein